MPEISTTRAASQKFSASVTTLQPAMIGGME